MSGSVSPCLQVETLEAKRQQQALELRQLQARGIQETRELQKQAAKAQADREGTCKEVEDRAPQIRAWSIFPGTASPHAQRRGFGGLCRCSAGCLTMGCPIKAAQHSLLGPYLPAGPWLPVI